MTQVQVAPEVLIHEEDGDAFLLHPGTGRYFGLNRTGVVIWRALEAGSDPAEAIAARWPGVSAETRARDVEALVKALLEAGLVTAAG